MRYWEEALCCALDEAGIPLPAADKLELAVQVIEGAFENYGMAHGHDCIPNPREGEIEKLQKELRRERNKVHCETCNGRGRVETLGPYHSSVSSCWKCKGEGRV
jgi:hypothetical protein